VILALAFVFSFVAQELGFSVYYWRFFLAGVLVAEIKSASVAKIVTIPLRKMFAAFFSSQ
jgi:Kef-type K+ transport system membrane component KefB